MNECSVSARKSTTVPTRLTAIEAFAFHHPLLLPLPPAFPVPCCPCCPCPPTLSCTLRLGHRGGGVVLSDYHSHEVMSWDYGLNENIGVCWLARRTGA